MSAKNGSLKATQTSSTTALQVDRSDPVARAVENERPGTQPTVHNHPTNAPTSGSDICASGARDYAGGIAAPHDGRIYSCKYGVLPFRSGQSEEGSKHLKSWEEAHALGY